MSLTNVPSLMLYCSIIIKGNEPFLQNGSQTVLHVESLGHGLHAFINGKLAGRDYSFIITTIDIKQVSLVSLKFPCCNKIGNRI